LALVSAAEKIGHQVAAKVTVDGIPDSGYRIAEGKPEGPVKSVLRLDRKSS